VPALTDKEGRLSCADLSRRGSAESISTGAEMLNVFASRILRGEEGMNVGQRHSEPATGEPYGDPPRQENALFGGMLIVLAFLCIAIMCAFVKAAPHVPIGTIIFFQNVIGLLLFGPWVLAHGAAKVKTSRIWLHIQRAVSGILSQALMFIALRKMPMMNAVLLGNSAPLFIPIIAWMWLKQKISGAVWSSLVLGFIGVILILDPNPASLLNPFVILAISAAFFSALALVTVNRLSITETSEQILFYYFLLSSLAAVPFAFATWKILSDKEWVYLIAIGMFMVAAQLFIILAYRYASAGRIAPFNYSVVVFSGLIGWLLWRDVPDSLSLAGVLLVSAGGILSTRFGGSS
jgi:drug/metabolite transporter (DMT)-like permease